MSDLPPLARRLSWDRGADGISDLDEDQIAALPAPIVIVGDPSAGKSVLMKTLGDTTGPVLLRAGSFVRNAKASTKAPAPKRAGRLPKSKCGPPPA